MFKENITREELTDLPLRWFEGEIFVIDKPEQVKDVAKFLSSQSLIGFDTETRPSFKKGVVNKVALLQLSTPEQAFLFRINKLGLPAPIRKILANPSIIKPGVAIRDDIKGLQEIFQFKPGGFIELQDVARQAGIQNFSLKKLTAIVLGFRISKSQQLSNWEATTLSEAQQIYAATDAWTAAKIYQHFFNN
ncbi:MAG: 3'-5' exonuclease [Mariniphaga sp.]|nr:3'-5' exonuclease domain-containing protein 2 [Mariniphaga sp.]MDD4226012.1 3'-5' exonuclease domain-containing protein 2 [Mariniphaga sp.]MDD4426438.1 3'-5' exonuclease domain-containing protein 2 [Mariniphaga sp.]